jgi:hypothetical protein
VETIDEGLEILSGIPAGAPTEDDGFEAGSINARVAHRLQEMAHQVKSFGGS